MRILLFGARGQLGWELQRALAPLGEVIALDRAHAGRAIDLNRPEDLRATVHALAPDVLVNAAAYTDVERAEAEPEAAQRINADAPHVLAQAMAARGGWMVQYSSDYVFPGLGRTPHAEDAPTGALNVYGRTKLEGERAVREACARHLILRSGWLFARRGRNFVRTILSLAAEHASLHVVNDQFGAPTSAELLADVSAHALRGVLLQPALAGTYHVAAAGETSWHGFAQHLVAGAWARGMVLRAGADAVQPITSAQYTSAARRPANGRLATDKLQRSFGLHLPPWQIGADRVLDEICA